MTNGNTDPNQKTKPQAAIHMLLDTVAAISPNYDPNAPKVDSRRQGLKFAVGAVVVSSAIFVVAHEWHSIENYREDHNGSYPIPSINLPDYSQHDHNTGHSGSPSAAELPHVNGYNIPVPTASTEM